MSNTAMTPMNKHLIDAGINWIIENGLTPHILVDAEYPTAQLPWDFVEDGKIILNISVKSCGDFFMDNDALSFKASFAGKRQQVYIPIGAIKIVYARENGMGIPLPEYPEYLKPSVEDDTNKKDDDNKKGPVFTVVK